jgi:hypothetical protein
MAIDITAKELLEVSEKANRPHDRYMAIKGVLLTAAEGGLFGAQFAREEYADSDFDELAKDPLMEVTRDERNTYVRWSHGAGKAAEARKTQS